MSFFNELKRRNVFRVGIAYAVGSWLLVQAGDVVFGLVGAEDWVLRTLAATLALGFIPVVIFAWAFEMTPEGIKREKEVDRTRSITHHTARKLDIATMVLLVGAIALLALDRFVPNATENATVGGRLAAEGQSDRSQGELLQEDQPTGDLPAGKSIAVLPFVDMSPAKDNEYFTDGLTEELLNILAQIKSLQVAGRTSSFAFKGKTEDLREIGEKLNVNTLLEGSVRKDDKNQKIRVTVQLINVADGYHIWSDNYDRDLEDIFAIQEDIALQVAEALKINLLGEEETLIAEHTRTDLNAYDLYLQGLQSLNTFSFEGLREAERLLQQALELDPGYQPARLALVKTLIEQAQTGVKATPEAIAMANPLLDEALENDPNNSGAHAFRGRLFFFQRNYDAAQASYQRALDSNPRNVDALSAFGRFLFDRDEIEEGLGYLQQAALIEPYDAKTQWDLCSTQGRLLNEAATLRECGRLGDIAAGNPMQYYGRMYFYQFQGRLAEAIVWREKAIESDPADPELTAGAANTWLAMGDLTQAKNLMERTAAIDSEHPATVVTRIAFLIQQEQIKEALDVVRQAYNDDLPDRHGSKEYIHRLLAEDYARQGNYNAALEILYEILPDGIESPMQSTNADDVGLMSNIALVMKLQNPVSEQAAVLLDHADQLNSLNSGRNVPFRKPFFQAMIESARGNKSAAIDFLGVAIEKGWRFDWREVMLRDLQFESLHNEPEFKTLVAMLEADMERQREQAYDLLGLNP